MEHKKLGSYWKIFTYPKDLKGDFMKDREYLNRYDIEVLRVCPYCNKNLVDVDFVENELYCINCKKVYLISEE